MRRILALCGAVLCFAVVAAAQENALAPAASNPVSVSARSALPESPGATLAAAPASSSRSGVPRRARSSPEYPWQLGIGYTYVRVRPNVGSTFSLHGLNTHIAYYFSNSVGLKAEVSPLFGTTPSTVSTFNSVPSLTMKALFFGGGPVIAYHNNSRIEPWVHGLFGGVHLRLTQTSATPGTANAFAFQAGGGADYKLGPRLYWRVEGDYFGTRFFSTFQHNLAFKTGVVFNF